MAGVPAGSTGASTIALAPHAPSRNWPSAPMFQSRIRKASEQARPVRMSGVALTSVSLMTPTLPNAATTMWPDDRTGSPPTNQMTPARTNAKDERGDRHQRREPARASVRGSRRSVMGSRSRRSPARGRVVAAAPPVMNRPISWMSAVSASNEPGDPALVHDDDPVGQGQELVELLGDQQDRGARLAQLEQHPVDALDAADVQPARGLDGHHQRRPGVDLAGEDEPLEVAARQDPDLACRSTAPRSRRRRSGLGQVRAPRRRR